MRWVAKRGALDPTRPEQRLRCSGRKEGEKQNELEVRQNAEIIELSRQILELTQEIRALQRDFRAP